MFEARPLEDHLLPIVRPHKGHSVVQSAQECNTHFQLITPRTSINKQKALADLWHYFLYKVTEEEEIMGIWGKQNEIRK